MSREHRDVLRMFEEYPENIGMSLVNEACYIEFKSYSNGIVLIIELFLSISVREKLLS